jgi:hypothetical protein
VRHDDGIWLALGATTAAGVVGALLHRRAGSRNLPREEWAKETFTGPLKMDPQRGVIVLSTWMTGDDPCYQHAIEVVQESRGLPYHPAAQFMERNIIPVEDAYKAWRHSDPDAHYTQNPAWLEALDLHPTLRAEAIIGRTREAAAWAIKEDARELGLTCGEPNVDLVDNTYAVCPLTSDKKLHEILQRLPIEGEGGEVEDNDGQAFQWNNHWYFSTFISVYPNGLTQPGIDLALVKSRVVLGGRRTLVAIPDPSIR